ncbi:BTAD domain-containing putative transcriptional regulator [Streptomyces sp. NPDC093109]|uniref:BTAD domain-containing putative transcriptional regulator n=1 Tax=Streptomyces sp. NPDC093109 TaxID=3154977 RepID=UPI00344C2EA7
MHRHTTWYSLLGPLEVLRDDTALDLGPRQRRVLLIRLLLEEGRPVSVGQLCQDLWEGSGPASAVSSLRAHISRLRSVLDPPRVGPGAPSVLVSGPSGYALKVPPEARDTARFEESVLRTREWLHRGQFATGREEIEGALGLWRGGALEDAAEYSFTLRETARLQAARQDAEELRVRILIKQGDLERAIHLAEGLTTSAPLREASWGLLMRALYGAGRSVEALRIYERFRTLLAEEFGLDPGPAMSELHTAILRHDTARLGEARTARSAVALADPRPNGLPLVGRAEETERLHALFGAASGGRAQWAVISGEPGSGKTRLLEELSARAGDDGFTVAWASGGQSLSEGHGVSRLDPGNQLLDALRRRNGTPAGPVDFLRPLAEKLAERPTLCVIDDLDWAPADFHAQLAQLAILLRDTSVVVVCALRDTEEPAVGGLLAELARHGAARLDLEPLSVTDVADLLALRRQNASPDLAAALHRRAEGNPFLLGELLKQPPEQRVGPAARVPAAVGSVVRARLAELAEPVRTMLNYAAVDGDSVDIGLLAEVQGLPPEQLAPLVDAAVTARVLVWDARDDGGYRFPDLPREVVLSTLTPSSRQILHAALARVLTVRPGADPARIGSHVAAAGPMGSAASRTTTPAPAPVWPATQPGGDIHARRS